MPSEIFRGVPIAATALKTLETLVRVLPHVVVAVLLAGPSVVSRLVWRSAGESFGESVRSRPLWVGVLVVAVLLVAVGGWWLLQDASDTVAARGVSVEESWLTFSGNAARSGTSVGGADETPITGRLRWQFRDALILERRPFASSPAVAGSRVIIGSDNFKLYCIDLMSGTQLWTFEANWPIFSSPVVWNGRVYVGEGLHEQTDSKFYCLDMSNGKVLWERQTTSHTESTPTVAEGRVYFGAGDEGVWCCDAMTGRPCWQFGDPHVDCCPLVVGGRVYFGSGYGFQGVFCVDAVDGRLVWKRRMPAPVWGAPSFANGRLYVGVGNGNFIESAEKPYGEVRCLDLTDGADVWRFTDPTDGVITSVAVRGKTAVFGSRDGCLYAVDAATGKGIWRADLGSPILSTPAICGNQVLFGADDGHFRCLDLRDGSELWSYDTTVDLFLTAMDARIQSSPAVAGGKVIFGAANGNVYCLGGTGTDGGTVVQARHASRLMRTADTLLMGTVTHLGALVGGLGVGVLLVGCVLRVLLGPLCWTEAREIARLKAAQPEVTALWREAEDYRSGRAAVHTFCTRAHIRPVVPLGIALVQVPLFLVAILVVQSAPAFAGKGFLWVRDLAAPDSMTLMSRLPLLGVPLTVLGSVFAVVLWVHLLSLGDVERRWRPGRLIGFFLLAVGLGWLTTDWSAASQLLVIVLVVLSIVQNAVLRPLLWPGPAGKS